MTNEPKEKFRAGQCVATVWENQRKGKDGKEYTQLSVSTEKTYKDGDDWKKTNSLNINDVPKMQLVLTQAYAYMHEKPETTEEVKE